MFLSSDEPDLDNELSRETWNFFRNGTISSLKIDLSNHLHGFCINNDDEIVQVGRDIGHNTNLKKIELEINGNYNRIEAERRLSLLSPEIVKNRSIRELEVFGFDASLGEGPLQFLSKCLREMESLSTVKIQGGEIIHSSHLLMILNPLTERGTPLKKLILREIGMNDHSIAAFSTAFSQHPEKLPKGLDLGNNQIGRGGCTVLAELLQTPKCSTRTLSLELNRSIDDDAIEVFLEPLKKNKTLKSLEFQQTNVTTEGMKAFSSTLCDTSSIQATYSSNHHLVSVQANQRLPPFDVQVFFDMNKSRNKSMVARRKVFDHHFLDANNFSMTNFDGMEAHIQLFIVDFIDRVAKDVVGRDLLGSEDDEGETEFSDGSAGGDFGVWDRWGITELFSVGERNNINYHGSEEEDADGNHAEGINNNSANEENDDAGAGNLSDDSNSTGESSLDEQQSLLKVRQTFLFWFLQSNPLLCASGN